MKPQIYGLKEQALSQYIACVPHRKKIAAATENDYC